MSQPITWYVITEYEYPDGPTEHIDPNSIYIAQAENSGEAAEKAAEWYDNQNTCFEFATNFGGKMWVSQARKEDHDQEREWIEVEIEARTEVIYTATKVTV